MATQADIDAVLAAIRAAETATSEAAAAQKAYDKLAGVLGASRTLLDAIVAAGTGTDAQLSALALSLSENGAALAAANADRDHKQSLGYAATDAMNALITGLSAPAP